MRLLIYTSSSKQIFMVPQETFPKSLAALVLLGALFLLTFPSLQWFGLFYTLCWVLPILLTLVYIGKFEKEFYYWTVYPPVVKKRFGKYTPLVLVALGWFIAFLLFFPFMKEITAFAIVPPLLAAVATRAPMSIALPTSSLLHMLVVAPSENNLFLGFAYNNLRRYLGYFAIFLVAIIAALFHINAYGLWNTPALLASFFFFTIMAVLIVVTQSQLAPWTMHGTWNILVSVAEARPELLNLAIVGTLAFSLLIGVILSVVVRHD